VAWVEYHTPNRSLFRASCGPTHDALNGVGDLRHEVGIDLQFRANAPRSGVGGNRHRMRDRRPQDFRVRSGYLAAHKADRGRLFDRIAASTRPNWKKTRRKIRIPGF
jgi:hypothetical protein